MTKTLKATRRAVSGVLLLNKPKGCSSNAALQQVRRWYGAAKTGHTGTLDPLASGLLPLLFGEATKFASALLDADKTYTATVRLGFSSTTGDAEGELTVCPQHTWQSLTLAQVKAACINFLGVIEQTPPMYSALKKNGKPLYEYARAGIEIERSSRTIHIRTLQVHNFSMHESGADLTFVVCCSKGTYVRTLAQDIAKALGTQGYLTQLERTSIGSLHVDKAYTPLALSVLQEQGELDACLLPTDVLLEAFPSLVLEPNLAARFLQGQRLVLQAPTESASQQRVKVYRDEPSGHVFLGSGCLRCNPEFAPMALLQPERLLQFI